MISINLTIHNKGFLLSQVLNAIRINTVSDYELICILDGCSDMSEIILDNFIDKNPQLKIKKLFAKNVFETKSNNIAAKNSDGEYIIIIQDDMIINEFGWDIRILKPFKAFDDIFAVTGKTAHNWVFNKNTKHLYESEDRDDAWSDILFHTDHANKDNLGRELFGVRDSVNRGPLAIKKDVFDKMGGFDEVFSPQDNDDHDLCYRVRKSLGLRCGCYPINIICDQSWGGTRENGATKSWMLKANQKNTKILYSRHGDFMLEKSRNENRELK